MAYLKQNHFKLVKISLFAVIIINSTLFLGLFILNREKCFRYHEGVNELRTSL
jgi:hypothetical protein